MYVCAGVLLAVLEKAGAIPPAERDDGTLIPSGIVSAGYQNFILCIEMLLASVALRFAFPVGIYRRETPTCALRRCVVFLLSSLSILDSAHNSHVHYSYTVLHFFSARCAAMQGDGAAENGGSFAGETATVGKSVSLQSISKSLKQSMNPGDIVTDAFHNFHPVYSQCAVHFHLLYCTVLYTYYSLLHLLYTCILLSYFYDWMQECLRTENSKCSA